MLNPIPAAPSLQGAPELSSELTADAIRARADGENFPVAPWGLPRGLREDLLALYGFARLVDQVGDDLEGDRGAMLDALSRDILRINGSEPRNPIVRRIALVVRRHRLALEPLERLIEGNRREQAACRISSWNELLSSCTRSANPIGELVLGILGRATGETIRLSDSICTALQVVEHCQDVVEDLARGRVYLPADDLARFGCRPDELAASHATPALRQTIQLQVVRARDLLAAAEPLLARLRGFGRLLVAAYVAGGLATCDALERHDYDVVSVKIRPSRRNLIRHWLCLVVGARWSRARN